MNQRLVVLETCARATASGWTCAHPRPGAAPPGYYMLFVLDNAGTPSVARWVRVGADAPAPAVLPDHRRRPPRPDGATDRHACPSATPSRRRRRPRPPPQLDRTAPRGTLSLRRRGRRLTSA